MGWDAAMKMTNIELDLIDNEAMFTFLERSMRGGVCQITKRFAKANNEQCGGDDFDPLALTPDERPDYEGCNRQPAGNVG